MSALVGSEGLLVVLSWNKTSLGHFDKGLLYILK